MSDLLFATETLCVTVCLDLSGHRRGGKNTVSQIANFC